MSYATLMVHVDVDAELGCRVGIAAGLAERFHAHLIGVAGWAPMSVFLAEDACNDRTPPDFHCHDMKTLLDRKGEQFQTLSAHSTARPSGGQDWIFPRTCSREKLAPPISSSSVTSKRIRIPFVHWIPAASS